jgi:membrane-bound inhibitor of C-type lysozyme
MKKFLWILLGAVVLVSAAAWYAGNQKNGRPADQSGSRDEAEERNLIARATYICAGGKTVAAAFYEGKSVLIDPGEMPVPSGSVEIVLSDGRSFNLSQTISASGARYANEDESFVFWDKGDTALILESGVEKDFMECVAPADNADRNIKVISPNGGEIWQKGQKIKILWEASKAIKSVNIRLMVADGGEGQSFNAAIAADAINTGDYEWTVQELYAEVWGVNALPASDKYMLVVEDAQKNSIYDANDAPFVIE